MGEIITAYTGTAYRKTCNKRQVVNKLRHLINAGAADDRVLINGRLEETPGL